MEQYIIKGGIPLTGDVEISGAKNAALALVADANCVEIDSSTISSVRVDYEYIKKIRASYYLLGALLGKYHKAEVALPGGCNIGSRPIDQHIKGFKALGAEVEIDHGMIMTEAQNLVGNHIYGRCICRCYN